VAAGRVAHAYLFSGPRGTGKTTTARLLAKAVNCLDEEPANRPCDACANCSSVNQGHFLDLIEIDAASNTSVDDVRDLRDKINFSPNTGRYKVYIVDEVHMLSTAAFNALLKTLEEPPPHAIFILATTEAHKIPATVLSRCQRHEFRRVPVADIIGHLDQIAAAEEIEIEPEALQLIARRATGSVRDAISLLDQLASGGGPISLGQTQLILGTATSQAVLDLVDALLADNPAQGLDTIQAALDGGSDPRQFARQIVDYLHDLLLILMGSDGRVEATPEVRSRMLEHSQGFNRLQLLAVIRSFNRAASESRIAWNPGLPLEIAYLESLAALEEPGSAGEGGAQIEGPPERSESPRSPSRIGGPSQVEPVLKTQEGPVAEAEGGLPEEADASGDPLSPKRIAQVWPDVLAEARKRNPQTQGLLNSCKPLGVKGDTLILGFASDLIKSKMEKPEHLAVTRDSLSQVFGADLKILCVVSAAVRGDKLKDLEGVDRDGIVAVAVRDLGGEIVDIQ
jgi:DNA polymerase-3 subunit gamma/tau